MSSFVHSCGRMRVYENLQKCNYLLSKDIFIFVTTRPYYIVCSPVNKSNIVKSSATLTTHNGNHVCHSQKQLHVVVRSNNAYFYIIYLPVILVESRSPGPWVLKMGTDPYIVFTFTFIHVKILGLCMQVTANLHAQMIYLQECCKAAFCLYPFLGKIYLNIQLTILEVAWQHQLDHLYPMTSHLYFPTSVYTMA